VAESMTMQMVAAGIAPIGKFVTIYSGMCTDWFTPEHYDRAAMRDQLGLEDRDVLVATVARLFKNKGYEQLIAAMSKAVQLYPNLQFVWVGDGADRERYEQQLQSLKLRSRVRLTGLLPPHEVPDILAAADILVHPSQWEGLPRSAIQALLMQIPVISFDIDGAAEVVIPDQTGILVPLNDLDKLAAAIGHLAADAELRQSLGRAGRTLCLERFDHHRMVDKIEQVYVDLARRKINL